MSNSSDDENTPAHEPYQGITEEHRWKPLSQRPIEDQANKPATTSSGCLAGIALFSLLVVVGIVFKGTTEA